MSDPQWEEIPRTSKIQAGDRLTHLSIDKHGVVTTTVGVVTDISYEDRTTVRLGTPGVGVDVALWLKTDKSDIVKIERLTQSIVKITEQLNDLRRDIDTLMGPEGLQRTMVTKEGSELSKWINSLAGSKEEEILRIVKETKRRLFG